MFSFNFRVVSLSKHIAIEIVIGMLLTQTNKSTFVVIVLI